MDQIVKKVESKLMSIAADIGYELVELQGIKLGGRTVVRGFIHKPGGVSVEDCKKVSRAFSDYLDLEDVIGGRYTLEISSLGLDRPLVKPADFRRRVGEKIKLELAPDESENGEYEGELTEVDDDGITLTEEDRVVKLGFDKIVKAKIVY